MRCGGCGAEYCYFHGGAHEGKTCADHIESTADGEKASTSIFFSVHRRLASKNCYKSSSTLEV